LLPGGKNKRLVLLMTHRLLSYQRDRYVPTEDLSLPFLDDIGGTLRGYRIFTACKTTHGKIFRLDDHLDRLYYSAAALYMKPPLTRTALKELLYEVAAKNLELTDSSTDLVLDVIFSGGLQGNTFQQSGKPAHLYVAVQELEPPPPELYKTGVVLATYPHQRMCADVKLLNYIGAVLAHQTVAPLKHAYDVVFVSPDDAATLLEGSTFTVFFVTDSGEILTHPLDGKILDSVTRRVVLELLAGRADMKVRETPVTLAMAKSASEAFLASTTRNVLPVVKIDDIQIGQGRPGKITQSVMELFEAYLNSY